MKAYTIAAALSLLAVSVSAQATPRAGTRRNAEMERLRIATATQHRTVEIRAAGVSENELQSFLNAMTQSNITPKTQLYYLTAERDAARANGPTDNFGSFVQGRLDAGLRGRALADAIHREHRLHGKGPHHVKPKKVRSAEREDGRENEQGEHARAEDRDEHGRDRDSTRHETPAPGRKPK